MSDELKSKVLPSRIRIDFQVREVSAAGEEIPDSDLRYVTFGDEVNLADIRDFFDRSGIAVNMMFNGNRGAKFICMEGTPANKIWMIKRVREVTGLGLREAKDLVEAPLRTPFGYFEDGRDCDAAVSFLNEDQTSGVVVARGANVQDLMLKGVKRLVWRRQ